MFSKTTLTAIQMLLALHQLDSAEPVPPRKIAESLGLSRTYLAKISNLLVKADILQSHKGAQGGVTMTMDPADISLLMIVEACQGKIKGYFCAEYKKSPSRDFCGFHSAMSGIYNCVVKNLGLWTLQAIADKPCTLNQEYDNVDCILNQAFSLRSERV